MTLRSAVPKRVLPGLGMAAIALVVVVSSALSACSATANIGDVWMSIDEDGSRRRNVFYTDSENITCVAQVGVGRKDVTVEILFRQLRGAVLGTRDFREVNAVITARDFHPDVTKDKPGQLSLTMHPLTVDENGRLKEDQQAPYLAGSYVCEVSLDGEQQGKAAFNIDYPPCPTTLIQTGTPCLGFYVEGEQCPAAGATGAPEPKCTCEATGWSCR
jgi:hypothetical protein